MEQFLQQIPFIPIGQADMESARSKLVMQSISQARDKINTEAGSAIRSSGFLIFLGIAIFPF
jgi:hypothetical protein